MGKSGDKRLFLWLLDFNFTGTRYQNKAPSQPRDMNSVARLVAAPVNHFRGRVYSMVERLEYSDEKQLLKRNVFSPWRKKTRPEPERTSHGTGKRCLQQSVLPGRTAVGPGSGGESCAGEFDSENDTRSTDNTVKLARWLKVSTSGWGFSKQRRYCWG